MKKINITLKDPIMGIINKSLMKLPNPSSISFLWNIGFLLGITLCSQILTGLVLSINFIAQREIAFSSVIHILRDLDRGWVIKNLHINGASLFFLLIFIHISRGIYFSSPPKVPIVWSSGLVILLCSIATAFIGYVLPWGQISFWGATVITSILSAIPYLGKTLTLWIWGNFSVSQPTLNRFLSLHFILPLAIVVLVLAHLIFLHKTGSSNPLGSNPNYDKTKFFPSFLFKDLSLIILVILFTWITICIYPFFLGDVENFSIARPTSTPTHIQPEWYFLFAYAILRSIPSKLGGVVAIVASILILTITCLKTHKNRKFLPLQKIKFWSFCRVFLILTWIGANPVEPPFILIGQVTTILYFSLVISP